MKKRLNLIGNIGVSALLLLIIGCQPFRPLLPEPTGPVIPKPVETEISLATETAPAPPFPQEAILILEPGPASEIFGPLRVIGEADPTFEQNLVVRVVDTEGNELALVPTTIQADMGLRGPFQVEIPLEVKELTHAFIQVYSTSALNGVVEHLASVGVRLKPTGPSIIKLVEPHPERIQIMQPVMGAEIGGGVVQVEGIGLASFEGTLIVQVYDEAGNLLGSEPLIVDAPEMGVPGTFSIAVPFRITTSGPGMIVVIDPGVAFDGDVHRSSVVVRLVP